MKPEDEIRQIIRLNGMVSCDQIADLENILERVGFKPNNPNSNAGDQKSDTQKQRDTEILTKILSWLK